MGVSSSKEDMIYKKKNRRKLPSIRSQFSKDRPKSYNDQSEQTTLSSRSTLPRRSSWRKSTFTNTTTLDDQSLNYSSSFYEEEASPRTSVNSDEVEDSKRRKMVSIIRLNEEPADPKPFWIYTVGDEKEYDRQLRQHYVLKHVLAGNIHLPLSTTQPITILDSVCGAGFWALDIANKYPNAHVIAMDIFSGEDKRLKGHPSINIPTNMTYEYGDIRSKLPCSDNSIDFIYQRDTIHFLSQDKWPHLLDEFMRILRPGGYIELVEYDFLISDPGPVLTLVNEWYRLAFIASGINPGESKDLHKKLQLSGFTEIETRVVSIPIGEWSPNQDERERGFLYKEVIRALFKSMKVWWISELSVTEQDFEKIFAAAMDEFEERECSVNWIIYTAKKA
ncbi:S-adenosyl-L-methionine-dependent methyltransferase [Pilobolus umbonatus]|nr:S-adenosyl-L-methionine-dependent methyltransferase [Pilobolus umbonatus]